MLFHDLGLYRFKGDKCKTSDRFPDFAHKLFNVNGNFFSESTRVDLTNVFGCSLFFFLFCCCCKRWTVQWERRRSLRLLYDDDNLCDLFTFMLYSVTFINFTGHSSIRRMTPSCAVLESYPVRLCIKRKSLMQFLSWRKKKINKQAKRPPHPPPPKKKGHCDWSWVTGKGEKKKKRTLHLPVLNVRQWVSCFSIFGASSEKALSKYFSGSILKY